MEPAGRLKDGPLPRTQLLDNVLQMSSVTAEPTRYLYLSIYGAATWRRTEQWTAQGERE
jgi:hypothetical protein